MKFWSDTGIVLSSAKYGEKYRIINIFTMEHGRFSALNSNLHNNFSIFSKVDIDWSSKNRNLTGFWKLKNEKQNWIFAMNSKDKMGIIQSFCCLINGALALGVKYSELFFVVETVVDKIQSYTEKELIYIYAYFEFLLLKKTGFGFDFGNQKKIPEIPKIWTIWNGITEREFFFQLSDIDLEEIKLSLMLTLYFIRQSVFPFDNFFRDSLLK